VFVDVAKGDVVARADLTADVGTAHGGIWLTPQVAGSDVIFGAVLPGKSGKGQELHVWAVSAAGDSVIRRSMALPDDEAALRPERYADNLFALIQDRLILADGETLTAYPVQRR